VSWAASIQMVEYCINRPDITADQAIHTPCSPVYLHATADDPVSGGLIKAETNRDMSDVGPASYGQIKIDQRPPQSTLNFGKR
jgi:hypothetical protein